jgi:hypothetical protein
MRGSTASPEVGTCADTRLTRAVTGGRRRRKKVPPPPVAWPATSAVCLQNATTSWCISSLAGNVSDWPRLRCGHDEGIAEQSYCLDVAPVDVIVPRFLQPKQTPRWPRARRPNCALCAGMENQYFKREEPQCFGVQLEDSERATPSSTRAPI